MEQKERAGGVLYILTRSPTRVPVTVLPDGGNLTRPIRDETKRIRTLGPIRLFLL